MDGRIAPLLISERVFSCNCASEVEINFSFLILFTGYLSLECSFL